jgi:hypothetical protein
MMRAVPCSRGELASSRIDGKNQDTLFAYVPDNGNRAGKRKDQCFASIARVLSKAPGMIIAECDSWLQAPIDKGSTAIYKVDTRTGNRRHIERSAESATFAYDQSGIARLRQASDDNGDPSMTIAPLPKVSFYVHGDRNPGTYDILDRAQQGAMDQPGQALDQRSLALADHAGQVHHARWPGIACLLHWACHGRTQAAGRDATRRAARPG